MKVQMGGSEIEDDKSEEYIKKQETDEGFARRRRYLQGSKQFRRQNLSAGDPS
jgi:hypothetical protein